MTAIFWDSNLFIYLFQKHPEFGPAVLGLWDRMRRRGDRLMTSAFTLGELLVHPQKFGNAERAQRYQNLFSDPASIQIINFDIHCAPHYAHLRGDRTISPADAIQLACAVAGRASLFITNDDRLSRKGIPGLPFISGLRSVPL